MEIGNKQTARIYENAVTAFHKALDAKLAVLAAIAEEGFSTASYLDARAKASVPLTAKSQKTKKETKKAEPKASQYKSGKERDKETKANTLEETLRLYESGLSIIDIAKKRGLALSTITGHISKLVAESKIKAEDVVSPEKIRLIINAADRLTDGFSLSKIKEALPGDISYDDIRIALSTRQQ